MSKLTLGLLLGATACAGRYDQLPDGSGARPGQAPASTEASGVKFELPVTIHAPWGPMGNTTGTPLGFGLFFAPGTCSTPVQLADSYVNAGFLQGSLLSTGIVFSGSSVRMPDTR